MASGSQVQDFYSQWFPTIASFLRLYLGDRERANCKAIDAFSEYMATGLPLDASELPIVLWECAADVAQRTEVPHWTSPDSSEFEAAILFLDSDERLTFLLHSFFGLPILWIALITGFPVRKVEVLATRSSETMRISLGFPNTTPPSVIQAFARISV